MKKHDSQSVDASAATLHPSPHVLLFICYNLLYFLPLMLMAIWGYSGGGVGSLANLDTATLISVSAIYFTGVIAFYCGSVSHQFVRWSIYGSASIDSRWSWLRLELPDKLFIAVILIIFLVSKLALIPLGVYHQYELEMMTGGAWSFSMFCSEALVLVQILVLVTNSKRNILHFATLTAINGINLLHGTRLFFIISCSTLTLYAYIRGHLSLRRIFLVGPIISMILLCASYGIFLVRSSVIDENRFTFIRVLSPIVYESYFSQLSLLSLVRHPDMWSAAGHFIELIGDVLINTAPRLILPDKDGIKFFDHFVSLSPLGAFSGYAQGLIYFGLFFPFFYFVLGVVASWLYRRAQSNSWWFILYCYFTSDFLFRIMRDGYLIPIKMLINSCQMLMIFVLWRWIFQLTTARSLNYHGLPAK